MKCIEPQVEFDLDFEDEFEMEIPVPQENNFQSKYSKESETELTLLSRFVPKSVHDRTLDISTLSGWKKRATITMISSEANVIKMDILNNNAENMDKHIEIFHQHCAAGDKYQIAIKELGLVTSINSCAYVQNGLLDALVFSLNPSGSIYSFAYQKSYTVHKKIPKTWLTEGLVRKIAEGPRPQFKFNKYDVFGKQKLDEVEVKKQKEDEQPWYSKYWWALLIGGFLFMQALAPPAEEEGAEGGQGGAPARAAGSR